MNDITPREVYIASSVKELAEKSVADLPRIDHKIDVKKYFHSGLSMLQQARIYRLEGDLEQAYMLYMKFCTLMIERLPKHRGYKDATAERAKMKQHVEKILGEMEAVKKVLESLYQQKELKKQAEIKAQQQREAMLQREKEEQAKRQQQYEALISNVQAEQKPMQLHNLEQQILLQQRSQLDRFGQSQPAPSAPQLDTNQMVPENLYNQQLEHPQQMQPYTMYAQNNQQNALQPDLVSFGESNPAPNPNGIMDAFTPLIDPQQEAIRQQLLEQQQMLLKQSQTMPSLPSVEPSAPLLPGLDEPLSITPSPGAKAVDLITSDPPQVVAPVADGVPHTPTPPQEPPKDTKTVSIIPESGTYRRLIVSVELFDAFAELVRPNTVRDVETCGILAGTLKNNCFIVTHVIVPKQTGSSDTCAMTHEDEVFSYQEENDLLTLGWIHTHPSHQLFLSSVDLHTHASYQLLLKESIAVVIAPRYSPGYGVFGLTDPLGVETISNCEKRGFHPHERTSLLYHEPKHVSLQRGNPNFKIVDLRRVK